jgi:hypothetical protein
MFHSAKGISRARGCQPDKEQGMLQFGDKFRTERASPWKGPVHIEKVMRET